MPIKFRIEKILRITGRGNYLLVRSIIPGQHFVISGNSFLDNVQLEKYLDMRRKIKENGEIDMDVYVLKLKNDHEMIRLKEGIVVELTSRHA